MSDYEWKTNPDWQNMNPQKGDIVLCHFTSGFEYSVKIIVSSIEENGVVGNVEGVFDLINGGLVRNHELEGKELTIQKNIIQEVIKKI